MNRPRLLDLFCGAGGCSKGYHDAGFEVVGVDIEPHPDYPYRFIRSDALLFASLLNDSTLGFAAVHASPPCQAHTTMSNRWRGKGGVADEHVDLIAATRDLLKASGLPYVIENVPGARAEMDHPVVLNGGMFGLRVDRPRLFECSFPVMVPQRVSVDNPVGVYGRLDGRRLMTRKDGSEQRAARTLEEGREAMGIDWMNWDDLREAVPPAYTQFIGEQLITVLNVCVYCSEPVADGFDEHAACVKRAMETAA